MSVPEMPSSPARTQAASSPIDSNQETHEDVENNRLEPSSNPSFRDQLANLVPLTQDMDLRSGSNISLDISEDRSMHEQERLQDVQEIFDIDLPPAQIINLHALEAESISEQEQLQDVPKAHDTNLPSELNTNLDVTENESVHEQKLGISLPPDVLPTCHRHGPVHRRNLVVCIDGTANQFGRKNTNVVELYSRIIKGSPRDQLTYYNSGIGTYATPSWKSWTYYKQVIGHTIDLALAWRFDRVLLDAYRWLSDNYIHGDWIYLFGFSRGAYQIRVLAGMIEKVGLIHRGNEAQIPFAWQLYRRSTDSFSTMEKPQLSTCNKESPNPQTKAKGKPQSSKYDGEDDMAARFKETFSHAMVTIHFVGAWDTVSSIGPGRGKVDLPLTALGMTHVCYFRHALALHERRVKFLPEYAQGGAGPVKEDGESAMPTRDGMSSSKMPRVKEVWFAGTHSDIGGGNTENASLVRNGPSLRWMVTQARNAGLHIGPSRGEWGNGAEELRINESLNGIWRVFELIPFKRLSYQDKRSTTRRLHRGQQREIVDGQLIHESVYRIKDKKISSEWLPEKCRNEALKELDPFDRVAEQASTALKILLCSDSKNDCHITMEELRELVYGENGTTTILADLSYMLFDAQSQIGLSAERARVAMQVLIALRPSNESEFARASPNAFPPIMREMLKKDDYKPVAREFLCNYASGSIFGYEFAGAHNVPMAITYCADEHTIALATKDGPGGTSKSLLAWQSFSIHKFPGAQTLAYSPKLDGKLAIGSAKGLWAFDFKTLQSLEISNQSTTIVSFSPDGEQMASCTKDPLHIIQMWRFVDGRWKQTGTFKPELYDFQFKHIEFTISGCELVVLVHANDRTHVYVLAIDHGTSLESKMHIIWDQPGPQALGVSKSGDMFYVGGHIGNVLHQWNSQGRSQLVLYPTDHHDGDMIITIVVPSPDGSNILVGSTSGIRIFNTKTGEQVKKVCSQDEKVVCAAWAPDGKSFAVGVVSGVAMLYDATPGHKVLERGILEGWYLEENPAQTFMPFKRYW
ncbi:hypothetical protein V5O48_007165 [Marasmius crinis-equi]|uniref:T6SS Phospholipase effector Tle1-like catalytic domain-containing protein n=1 Tax=Marasmius crinis-equi TaxID=585013 RepID=A0ABR3FHH9_9AGAR